MQGLATQVKILRFRCLCDSSPKETNTLVHLALYTLYTEIQCLDLDFRGNMSHIWAYCYDYLSGNQ